jgi:hypothetical protein
MKLEIKNSESINFSTEKPMLKVGVRYFYKCKFKKTSLKNNSNLKHVELYYITEDYNNTNNGAYLLLQFDKDMEQVVFFEYLRKPEEDIESIEYVVLEFMKRMEYDIKKFKKDKKEYIYFNVEPKIL